jgi:hypothetical protein
VRKVSFALFGSLATLATMAILATLATLATLGTCAQTPPKESPLLTKSDMIIIDFPILAQKKAKLGSGDAHIRVAYQALLKTANRLLSYGPVSVMMKTATPPSGTKHDYMSIAPYFWPDPNKPGGLPYINRDGEVNPEVHDYPDKENMPKLCENVYLLGLAYYYSGNEKYAAKVAQLLRVWFLDTATRMNPNLNFGQAVKGVTNGRSYGLIDTRHFVMAIDAIKLLRGSPNWTPSDDSGMKQWFADFLNWMQTNPLGVAEMNATNNHGVWYDAQRLAMAIYLDSTDLANRIVQKSLQRLDDQMDDQGNFPKEMARTTSLHYTVFCLNAFVVVAQLSEETAVNLWKAQTPSGKSLQMALDALLPYLSTQKAWTGQQITQFNEQDAVPYLLRSADHLNCPNCMRVLDSTANEDNLMLCTLL